MPLVMASHIILMGQEVVLRTTQILRAHQQHLSTYQTDTTGRASCSMMGEWLSCIIGLSLTSAAL